MKLKLTFALISLALLAGCGTVPYTPQEHALRDGLIPALTITGDLAVNNTQDATAQVIVYSYMGTQFSSNYKDITQLMVEQAKKEIAKAGKKLNPGKAKTIDIKVSYLKSSYIAFFWKSELKYTVVLGGVKTVSKTVTHASGAVIQDLNGCIAESVIDLLNDPQVTAYLAE